MSEGPGGEWTRGFWVRHAVAPLGLFVLLAIPFEVSDLDLWATDPFFDFATGNWPYLKAWWAKDLLHDRGQNLVWLFAGALAVAFAGSFRNPALAPWRRPILYAGVCLAVAPLLVAILKLVSGRHCPWEIARYGGRVPWTRLFEAAPPVPPDAPRGRCWPASHASSGMALCALYFVGRVRGSRRLWLWALPAIVLGAAFALCQQARGAHFLSHNLWSAVLCWVVALAAYRLMGGTHMGRR